MDGGRLRAPVAARWLARGGRVDRDEAGRSWLRLKGAKRKPLRAAFWGICEGGVSGDLESLCWAAVLTPAADLVRDLATIGDQLLQGRRVSCYGFP